MGVKKVFSKNFPILKQDQRITSKLAVLSFSREVLGYLTMAFHVPFNQRPSGRTSIPGPIYIGFDVPAPLPRRKFNWWGFNGMWMSFASLVTAGFLSPIPLLISLIGLRRPGKIMASIGLMISLLGTAMATFIGVHAYNHSQDHAKRQRAAQVAALNQRHVEETKELLVMAVDEVQQYQQHNDGFFPGDIDGNMLVIKYVDPWGNALRFDLESDHAYIRSAGPDGKFDSSDDVFEKLEGKSGWAEQPLLTLE